MKKEFEVEICGVGKDHRGNKTFEFRAVGEDHCLVAGHVHGSGDEQFEFGEKLRFTLESIKIPQLVKKGS